MPIVEETIEVAVPLPTAYEKWTQFEEFPDFMDGIESVEQLSETRTRWKAAFAGQSREWEAEVTEQTTEHKIAWEAVEGAEHAGAVTFEALGETATRVTLQLEVEPEGAIEKAAEKAGLLDKQIRADLGRFKKLIETE